MIGGLVGWDSPLQLAQDDRFKKLDDGDWSPSASHDEQMNRTSLLILFGSLALLLFLS
jgi:hypothetical protein